LPPDLVRGQIAARALPNLLFGAARPYISLMAKFALAASLLALLAVSIWFAFGLWGTAETAAMPVDGYIAMAVGIFFSIVVGCGLMALVFYSSRYGYDEPAGRERPERDGPAR
jgi:hypothetical protein